MLLCSIHWGFQWPLPSGLSVSGLIVFELLSALELHLDGFFECIPVSKMALILWYQWCQQSSNTLSRPHLIYTSPTQCEETSLLLEQTVNGLKESVMSIIPTAITFIENHPLKPIPADGTVHSLASNVGNISLLDNNDLYLTSFRHFSSSIVSWIMSLLSQNSPQSWTIPVPWRPPLCPGLIGGKRELLVNIVFFLLCFMIHILTNPCSGSPLRSSIDSNTNSSWGQKVYFNT